MSTIIIPAHNEATVIKRCLDSIVQQTETVEKIIVACNACTDDTVKIVKTYSEVHCLELDKASKTHAINAAEKYISSYPVFYIDADTYLDQNAVKNINRAIVEHGFLLVAPTPIINTTYSSWLVKSFYRVWLNLPYVREGVIATCSYILTEAGRQRFSHFPELISDDGFVRGHFETNEMANIVSAKIYIQAPKNILSLIKIKTRARLGNIELSERKLSPISHEYKYRKISLKEWGQFNFIDLFLYLFIQSFIRIRSTMQFMKINRYQWERDNSSR